MQTPLDYCTVVFKKEPSKFEKYGTASADLFFKAHVQRVSPLYLTSLLDQSDWNKLVNIRVPAQRLIE